MRQQFIGKAREFPSARLIPLAFDVRRITRVVSARAVQTGILISQIASRCARRVMDGSPQDSKYWNNTQAYTMAVICMILGIVAGYLLHAPASVAAGPSAGSSAAAP